MTTLPPAPQVPSVPGYQAGVPPTGYRPLKASENTEGVQQNAMRIWKETKDLPYGSQSPFEIDGQKYVGRVEQHWHPQGYKGENIGGQHWGPSGWHRGVSVYKSTVSATQAPVTETTSAGRSIFLQRISDFLDKLNQAV